MGKFKWIKILHYVENLLKIHQETSERLRMNINMMFTVCSIVGAKKTHKFQMKIKCTSLQLEKIDILTPNTIGKPVHNTHTLPNHWINV